MKLTKDEYQQFKLYVEEGCRKRHISPATRKYWVLHVNDNSHHFTALSLYRLALIGNPGAPNFICTKKLTKGDWVTVCRKLFREWKEHFTRPEKRSVK